MPSSSPCVLLGGIARGGGDALNVDAVRFGQVVRGEGRHALVVLLWIVYHESEILEHLIQFIGVDASIHPTHTVRGHLPEAVFQTRDQSVVGAVVLGDGVHRLIVLQPEGDVPGLIVCPTVEGLTLGDDAGRVLASCGVFACVYCRRCWGDQSANRASVVVCHSVDDSSS